MKNQTLVNPPGLWHYTRVVIAAPLLGFGLGACGSDSGSDDSSTVLSDAVAPAELVTDDSGIGISDTDTSPIGTIVSSGDEDAASSSDEDRIGLAVDSTQRCAVVDDTIELVLTRDLEEGESADIAGEFPNVTGFVTFTQIFGRSLNIVSRTDESAIFTMSQQDIVGLTAEVDNGSVTTFLAAYDNSAPDDFIMRKPVVDGCLYAFKAGDYCVAGLSKAGPLTFNRNDLSMSALGCEVQNPDNLTLLELPAGS